MALADGRIVVARQVVGAGAPARAAELVRRFDRLAASGIAVARPAVAKPQGDELAWVLTPWVEGAVGATALGTPSSARRLAGAMGRLAEKVADVDPDGLQLGRQWADPDKLAEAGLAWLGRLADTLDPRARQGADRALDATVSGWADGAPWEIGLSHGDFAPINVIVRPDASLVLLDLDDLQLGPRLLDIAWWGWVVRYHHPHVWQRAWLALLKGASFEWDGPLDRAATALARIRLLERAAKAQTAQAQSLWLQRLDETKDW